MMLLHERSPHFLAVTYKITEAADGEKTSSKADSIWPTVSNRDRKLSLADLSKASFKGATFPQAISSKRVIVIIKSMYNV